MIWIEVQIGGKRHNSGRLRTLASAGAHRMLELVLITNEGSSRRTPREHCARGYVRLTEGAAVSGTIQGSAEHGRAAHA
jgi:hypothetical protein